MYQIGDKVVYGNIGVCIVRDISELDFMDNGKEYYTLQPYYDENKMVYTPLDNQKQKLRPMITKAEAEAFILKLPTIEPGNYVNEKERKEAYRDAILSANLEKWASMIHYIYKKEQERMAKGQKISAHYMEELKGIEKLLLGELAAALGLSMDDIKGYLEKELNR